MRVLQGNEAKRRSSQALVSLVILAVEQCNHFWDLLGDMERYLLFVAQSSLCVGFSTENYST